MKKILLPIFLLISIFCFGQTKPPQVKLSGSTPNNEVYTPGALRIDGSLGWPLRDTNYIPERLGYVVVRPQDGIPYIYLGGWFPFNATIRTIFASNGTQAFNDSTFGLGGILNQNTTISHHNLYNLLHDSVAAGGYYIRSQGAAISNGIGILGLWNGTVAVDLVDGLTPSNFISYFGTNSASGAKTNGIFRSLQTVATTGNIGALEGFTKTSNATGVVALANAVLGTVDHSGAGTLTAGRAIGGSLIVSGNGTITSAISIYAGGVNITSASGVVTTAYGLYIDDNVPGTGTIGAEFGIFQHSTTQTNQFNGPLIINNRFSLVTRTINTSQNLATSDDVLYCTDAGGTLTVTLPSASTYPGRSVWVKNLSTTHNVILSGMGVGEANTLGSFGVGNANFLINSDGSVWRVLAQTP